MSSIFEATPEQQNAFARLSPNPELLRAIAAAAISRARTIVTDCAEQLSDTPEHPLLLKVRDALPKQAVAESAEVAEHLDSLWQRVTGRTPYEQLLSLHLAYSIAHDALVGYGQLHTPSVDLDEEIDWEVWQEPLAAYFRALFARDTRVDDRLAMWGRRIAGDAVLWSRRIAGIADGKSAETLHPGSEQGAERFASYLFAGHSRRMNALALAA